MAHLAHPAAERAAKTASTIIERKLLNCQYNLTVGLRITTVP